MYKTNHQVFDHMVGYFDPRVSKIERLSELNENYHEDGVFLMEDTGSRIWLDLREATEKNKLCTFRGKFQEAEQINKNKRVYPYAVLDENVKRLQECIDEGGLIGECDHAADSVIHFTNASHKITKLWWDGNVLMGEGQILNTPHGKLLKTLIDDGVGIGISSRGVGNGKVNEDGILVIGESYRLITFDAVADPSTNNAFQKANEASGYVSRKESYTTQTPPSKNSYEYSQKNENTRIHKNTKDLVIACLGGIVKSETFQLKQRLSNHE